MTDRHWRRLAVVAVLTRASIAVASASAQALPDSAYWQPTDPCEVVVCDAKVQQLGIQVISSMAKESTEAIARRCHSAVGKYRPAPGEPVRQSALADYVAACLRPIASLEALRRDVLQAALFYLEVAGNPCTGVLLEDGTALTARHCFADADRGIRDGDLRSARLRWLNGVETSGVRVVRDPAGAQATPASDYILVEPIDKSAMPQVRVRLATREERHSAFSTRTRVILPSFLSREHLVVDDFAWCLIRSAYENKGYFKHHCQTLPGSSGAPVLLWNAHGDPIVLGVHVGVSGTLFRDGELTGSNEAVIVQGAGR